MYLTMKIFYSREGEKKIYIYIYIIIIIIICTHKCTSVASNVYTGLKAISWMFDRDRVRALVNAVINLHVP
jgi:hypothetical protein